MSRISVFFAEGFEEIEALMVVDVLRRANLAVTMVSVTDADEVTGSHDITVRMDAHLTEFDFKQTDVIVLPGGMPGTKKLAACSALMEQVDAFYREGKVIGAICAAPGILGQRGLLKGRRVCAHPSVEGQLTEAILLKEKAVIDGTLITGRGMGCALDFALALVRHLKGINEAEQIAESICYNKL